MKQVSNSTNLGRVARLGAVALGLGLIGLQGEAMGQVRSGGPGPNAKPPLQRGGSLIPPDRPSTQPRPTTPPTEPPSHPGHPHPGHPYYPSYPYYGHSYGYLSYRYSFPIYGPTGYVDPSLAYRAAAPAEPVPVPRELTTLERADLALRSGDADEAVTLYREHLDDDASDAKSMRKLALALLDADEIDQASAVMALAYETDPKLAGRPIDAEAELEGGARELRLRVGRVVAHAHRSRDAGAWLTVAVLMQAQGKDDRADEMVRRAEEVGLSKGVARALHVELGS